MCGKTDLRKEIDGLTAVVTAEYDLDPYEPALFLFCGSRADLFKGLFWEADGFILLYKRYENGRLQWPRTVQEARKISNRQLESLMNGMTLEPTIHAASHGYIF